MLQVVFAEEGLYVHMRWFGRPFHSPFLLPWECVRRVEEVKGSFRKRWYQVVVEGAQAQSRQLKQPLLGGDGEDADANGAGSMELWLPGKAEVEQELRRYLPPDRMHRVE